MDILDDEVMDQWTSQHFHASQKELCEGEPADTPITVVYQESVGIDIQWPEMEEDIHSKWRTRMKIALECYFFTM